MFLQKIWLPMWASIKGVFSRLIALGRKFGWVKVGIVAFLLIIGAWTVAGFVGGKKEAEVASNPMRTVELRSVAELSSGTSALAVAGNISSKSEASVRAERGGQITRLNAALGNYVGAGTIIAELSNASERAAVAQAQAGVDAAAAGASVSATTLSSAKESGVAALLSAYGTVDKSIRTDIDPMFGNPEGVRPQFKVQSANSQAKINAENMRLSIGTTLTRQRSRAATLSSSDDLVAELTVAQRELRNVRDFLDEVVRTLSAGISSNEISDTNIATYLGVANAARSSITSTLAGLVSTQQAIETAQKNIGSSGGTSASGAALAQAQAGLAAARANLEKTIIRAPISGTINALPLKVGDYLSPSALAVTIANNGALEVVAYITDTDARDIAAGASATVDAGSTQAKGTVTKVAPAIDPTTKKIEVRVGITEGASSLVNGQAATVLITRNAKVAATSRIIIPISALKVGADATSVFTVDENNRLVAHAVTLGTLLGDRVVIASGITPDMNIVVDARGFQPGQEVLVK